MVCFHAVREQGNLLLCTLLLGNVIINSALSILLADLTTGPIGLIASTAIILIFGKQEACSATSLFSTIYPQRVP